ncbi:cation:proton antiporter [Streptomyces pathocidini]|uniref:cation:proton antiporter n=1 Tax=Streptomyces pathocidini TaxID=1650571 RepID=UPI00340BBA5A
MAVPPPVPPLPGDHLLLLLLQAGLLLLVAGALGQAARRCAMPAVVGELLAGVLLGPSVLFQFAPGLGRMLFPADPGQFHLLDAIGQLSVVLLVGTIGLRTDAALLHRRGKALAHISGGGLLVPLGLGVGCGLLVPAALVPYGVSRQVFALFLGVAMCVSAIPVIARTLSDLNLLHREVGQLSIAAALLDDLFGWLMLSFVTALATTGTAGQIASALLLLLGVAILTVFPGRPIVRAVMARCGHASDPPVTIVAVVALILLSASATHALGLEPILGAFLCGLLIGHSPAFRPASLTPLTTVVNRVLAPLYFTTVGLRTDLTVLADAQILPTALAVLAIAVAGKFTGVFVGALTARLGRWEALAIGAALNARGVIEVVIAGVGLRIGVLNTASFTVIVLIALTTSLMVTPILRWAMAHIQPTAQELHRLACWRHHQAENG